MWCKQCHYGSDVHVMTVMEDGQKKCGQCGLVANDHPNTNPFNKKQEAKPTKTKTKKRNSRDDFFEHSDNDEPVKAMDYSKGQ